MPAIEYLYGVSPGTLQANGIYYHTSYYNIDDGSIIYLFGSIPAILFNPGDLTYGTANTSYYQNVSGNYVDTQNGYDYEAYNSVNAGVSALFGYLEQRFNSTSIDTTTSQLVFKDDLLQFFDNEYGGPQDVNELQAYGLREPLRSVIS